MQKEFKGWLILDWKTGKMRVTRKQTQVKYTEIPIKMSLQVEIPEKPQTAIEGNIKLSETKATKIIASIVEEQL